MILQILKDIKESTDSRRLKSVNPVGQSVD